MINLLAGFARRFEESLVNYIEQFEEKSLLTEYEDLKESYHKSTDNFLYFVLRQYLSDQGSRAKRVFEREEHRLGIHRVPSRHGFEMETQVIELGKLEAQWFDPRLGRADDLEPLRHSECHRAEYRLSRWAWPLTNCSAASRRVSAGWMASTSWAKPPR